MKKIALAITTAVLFAACNNAGENKTETPAMEMTEQTTEETAKPIAGAKIDPICEMEKDSTWTEYTVYKNDTVWFCSDVCKGAFLKNPDKYAAKLH